MEYFHEDDKMNKAIPAELRARIIAARDAYARLLGEAEKARLEQLTKEPRFRRGRFKNARQGKRGGGVLNSVTHGWLRQVQWVFARLAGCPEAGCGAGVLRPKCFWEFGPDCPRHKVTEAYGGRHAIHKHLEELKAKAIK